MVTIFQINETELDSRFLKSLKSMFKNRKLTLTVEAEEIDETSYLMSSSINNERLMQAIKNVENGKNLVEIDLNDIKKMANA